MESHLSAMLAEFLDFHLVRMVSLITSGDVILVLAFSAL